MGHIGKEEERKESNIFLKGGRYFAHEKGTRHRKAGTEKGREKKVTKMCAQVVPPQVAVFFTCDTCASRSEI